MRAHVVMFDLRGCGRSARTAPLGTLPDSALQPDLLADDIAGLVEHLGVASADVLGFSYGGRIAMRVVDQHPARVRRLILASPTAYRDADAATADIPVDLARRLHAELPASTLVEIPDAAHMAQFDNPAAWLGAVRDFLMSNVTSAA